jgi:hypothetical protein
VGGHQDRHALRGDLADHGQHLADQLRVQRAGDLVEQQHSRPHGQGPGDGHPLLLAAGEPVGVLAGLVGQTDAGQERPGLLLRLGLRAAVHDRGSQGHVVQHGQVREQVVGLEHHAEPAADLVGVDPRIGDVLAVEEHLPVVDGLEQAGAAQQGGLARARAADQRHHLVLAHGQVDPAEDDGVAEGLHDAADVEDRCAHRWPPDCWRRRARAVTASASRAEGTASSTNSRPATT